MHHLQLPDGSFDEHTTFITSLIVIALAPLTHDLAVRDMLQRATTFLMAEFNEASCINYWKRSSPQYLTHRCPDDLDVLSVTLTALHLAGHTDFVTNKLASYSKILILSETTLGGPYYTWIHPHPRPAEWSDVDVVVNANIAHILKLQNVELPNLNAFIESALTSLISAYYPPLSALYFISKGYSGTHTQEFITRTLSYTPQNILERALRVTTLINFGYPPTLLHEDIQALARNHTWETFPLYLERDKGGKHTHVGNPALTHALTLEALHLATQCNKPAHLTIETPHLLPQAFYDHLVPSLKKQLNKATITTLCKATEHGWRAYTIYDNILDHEAPVSQLSEANTHLRATTSLFCEALADSPHLSTILSLLDTIDQANRWEYEHCYKPAVRPDYGSHHVLAEKSIGHACGPLTIMIRLGFTPDSPEYQHLHTFFVHYLIARQMNDDAHDWPDDLKRGFINSASVHMCGRTDLTTHFFEHVLPLIITDISSHLSHAEQALSHLTHIMDTRHLHSLLTPLRHTTEKARTEHVSIRAFLSEFEKGKPTSLRT